jgi:hypothetical protein
MRWLCAIVILAASGCGAARPPRPVEPPFVAVGPASPVTNGRLRVALVLANPTDASLRVTGYDAGSFDPPLASGVIAPLYRVQRLDGDRWIDADPSFCGYGVTQLSIPAGSARRFHAEVPAGSPARVGVRYVVGDREEVAWTEVLGAQP